METLKTIEVGDKLIRILPDTDAEAPDSYGDKAIFLIHDHRNFEVEVKGFPAKDVFIAVRDQDGPLEYDGYWVFPVIAYIHSGVSLTVQKTFHKGRLGWDYSFCGFVLVSKKEWNDYEKAFSAAGSLATEWNTFLAGGVVGYEVIDKESGETLDSCWGFYEEEFAIEQAKDWIEATRKANI